MKINYKQKKNFNKFEKNFKIYAKNLVNLTSKPKNWKYKCKCLFKRKCIKMVRQFSMN